MRSAVLLLLLLSFSACDVSRESASTPSDSQAPPELKCGDHFHPLQQGPWATSHLAFNTVTGQMCRTWDWTQANAWGITSENLPVCESQKTTATRECPDRFELQSGGPWPEAHLATDTKVGRLCRTWDWEQPSNAWQITRDNTPTCASLAK